MIEPIVILEAIAMVFYLIAIYMCFLRLKKCDPDFQIVFILMMLALLMGALTSLMDVLQWANIGLSFLAEGMEEALTPLFGFIWAIAAYVVVKRTKKTVTVTKQTQSKRDALGGMKDVH